METLHGKGEMPLEVTGQDETVLSLLCRARDYYSMKENSMRRKF